MAVTKLCYHQPISHQYSELVRKKFQRFLSATCLFWRDFNVKYTRQNCRCFNPHSRSLHPLIIFPKLFLFNLFSILVQSCFFFCLFHIHGLVPSHSVRDIMFFLFFFSFFLFPFSFEDPDQVPSTYGSLFTDICTPFFLQANTSVTHEYHRPFLSKSASA